MTSIHGKVVEVGYDPSQSGLTKVHYALVKVRVSRSRSQETAERQLERLTEQLLRKQVSIFPLTEATE